MKKYSINWKYCYLYQIKGEGVISWTNVTYAGVYEPLQNVSYSHIVYGVDITNNFRWIKD